MGINWDYSIKSLIWRRHFSTVIHYSSSRKIQVRLVEHSTRHSLHKAKIFYCWGRNHSKQNWEYWLREWFIRTFDDAMPEFTLKGEWLAKLHHSRKMEAKPTYSAMSITSTESIHIHESSPVRLVFFDASSDPLLSTLTYLSEMGSRVCRTSWGQSTSNGTFTIQLVHSRFTDLHLRSKGSSCLVAENSWEYKRK